jgi:hypothetical protein
MYKGMFPIFIFKLIADYIEDVDQLGLLSPDTKRVLSMIVSRQRKLDSSTLGLFLGTDELTLELFDCTCNYHHLIIYSVTEK